MRRAPRSSSVRSSPRRTNLALRTPRGSLSAIRNVGRPPGRRSPPGSRRRRSDSGGPRPSVRASPPSWGRVGGLPASSAEPQRASVDLVQEVLLGESRGGRGAPDPLPAAEQRLPAGRRSRRRVAPAPRERSSSAALASSQETSEDGRRPPPATRRRASRSARPSPWRSARSAIRPSCSSRWCSARSAKARRCLAVGSSSGGSGRSRSPSIVLKVSSARRSASARGSVRPSVIARAPASSSSRSPRRGSLPHHGAVAHGAPRGPTPGAHAPPLPYGAPPARARAPRRTVAVPRAGRRAGRRSGPSPDRAASRVRRRCAPASGPGRMRR